MKQLQIHTYNPAILSYDLVSAMMMVHKSLVIVITVATILVSLSSQGKRCMHAVNQLNFNA